MPINESGRGKSVNESERIVIVKIQHDGYVAFLREGDELFLITSGGLNEVNHDCEIDRSHFPPLHPGTEVKILTREPNSWSGRILFHGDGPPLPDFCPRCAIDIAAGDGRSDCTGIDHS